MNIVASLTVIYYEQNYGCDNVSPNSDYHPKSKIQIKTKTSISVHFQKLYFYNFLNLYFPTSIPLCVCVTVKHLIYSNN